MTPDDVDLDYLRGKVAEYRRHARALPATRMSARLLEIARQYETRLHALEEQQSPPRRAGK